MKNLTILLLVVCFLSACEKKTEVSEKPAPVALPMELSYKGTPVIGTPSNLITVMECNKRLGMLNTDIGEFLADTVTWHLADGFEVTAPRDSVLTIIKSFFGDLSSMKLIYTAAVPVDNPDLKHEWVFSWTDETYTHKDGKVEHLFMHEDYRLEAGKIREIYQYSRKAPGEAPK